MTESGSVTCPGSHSELGLAPSLEEPEAKSRMLIYLAFVESFVLWKHSLSFCFSSLLRFRVLSIVYFFFFKISLCWGWGAVLCIVRCLAASLASIFPSPHPALDACSIVQLWQSEMSSAIATCPPRCVCVYVCIYVCVHRITLVENHRFSSKSCVSGMFL